MKGGGPCQHGVRFFWCARHGCNL